MPIVDCNNVVEVKTQTCSLANDLEEQLTGSENQTTTNFGAKTVAKLVSERVGQLGNIAVDYVWEDATDRNTETGMTANQTGFQIDTGGVYKYDGAVWNLLELVPIPNNYGFKNYLINGGLDVWQRGTSFTNTGGGSFFTADRWATNFSLADGDISIIKNSSTIRSGESSITMLLTSGGSGSMGMSYKIEYNRLFSDVNRSFKLSFYANFSIAKTINIRVRSDGTGATTQNNNVNTSVGWEKYEIDLDVGTIPTDSTNVRLLFDFYEATESGTVEIAQVQLEEGGVATPFEQRPYGLELSLCQRYYEKINIKGPQRRYASGGLASYDAGEIFYKVEKRAIPTILFSNQVYVNCSSLVVAANRVERLSNTVTTSSAGTYSVTYTIEADSEL